MADKSLNVQNNPNEFIPVTPAVTTEYYDSVEDAIRSLNIGEQLDRITITKIIRLFIIICKQGCIKFGGAHEALRDTSGRNCSMMLNLLGKNHANLFSEAIKVSQSRNGDIIVFDDSYGKNHVLKDIAEWVNDYIYEPGSKYNPGKQFVFKKLFDEGYKLEVEVFEKHYPEGRYENYENMTLWLNNEGINTKLWDGYKHLYRGCLNGIIIKKVLSNY